MRSLVGIKNVIQVTDVTGDEHFIGGMDDTYPFLDRILTRHKL